MSKSSRLVATIWCPYLARPLECLEVGFREVVRGLVSPTPFMEGCVSCPLDFVKCVCKHLFFTAPSGPFCSSSYLQEGNGITYGQCTLQTWWTHITQCTTQWTLWIQFTQFTQCALSCMCIPSAPLQCHWFMFVLTSFPAPLGLILRAPNWTHGTHFDTL